jgi:hypothetical protein
LSRPLNLASQPFRNETLPALLFGLGALTLAGLTVWHAVSLVRLRPGVASPQQKEVVELEAEAARIRSEAAAFRVPEPDPKLPQQWTLIKELVDQRALRWTELLSVLEEALPSDVRVVHLLPAVEAEHVSLELTVIARTPRAGLELLPVLEKRGEFDSVYPVSVAAREDGSEYRYAMLYRPPSGAPQPQASPADAPETGTDEPASDSGRPERPGAPLAAVATRP